MSVWAPCKVKTKIVNSKLKLSQSKSLTFIYSNCKKNHSIKSGTLISMLLTSFYQICFLDIHAMVLGESNFFDSEYFLHDCGGTELFD